MTLIDRYVYTVTGRLSEKIRDEVSMELRANIQDMLPENPTENDVRNALEKLGNPIRLAHEYCDTKRYLIGPGLYDRYLSVLKLVISILITVSVVAALLKGVTSPPVAGALVHTSFNVFGNMLGAAVEGIMQGFIWVTMIFVLLERAGINEGEKPFANKKWSPDDLPKSPGVKRRKISRSGTVLSMVSTLFFTGMLYFNHSLIGLYWKGDSDVTFITPFFVDERLQAYIPLIIILALSQYIILIWKFISVEWTKRLAIANAVSNIALCGFLVLMMRDHSLFNQGFITELARLSGTSLSQVANSWSWGVINFAIIVLLVYAWDSVKGFMSSPIKKVKQ